MATDWPDEMTDRLRELWAEGHSTAEIGRRLGVSKNAVAGKAHRLDLPARPSPIRREGERPPPRASAPRRVAVSTLPPLSSATLGAGTMGASAVPAVVAAPRPPVALPPRPAAPPRVALTASAPRPYGRVITCCWPIGEPGTRSFRFCDLESVPGKPYCEQHAQMAYVKVRDRREDVPHGIS